MDIVLERGAHEVAGVEVKAAATITARDFRGLWKLKEAAGKRFTSGVVLYDGETLIGSFCSLRQGLWLPRRSGRGAELFAPWIYEPFMMSSEC